MVPVLVAQTSDWAQEEEKQSEESDSWEGDLTLTSPEGDSEVEEEEESSEVRASSDDGDSWGGEVKGGEEGSGDEGLVGSEGEYYPEPPEEAKLYVGNLPFDVDSEKLAELFNQVGIVEIAEVKFNFFCFI